MGSAVELLRSLMEDLPRSTIHLDPAEWIFRGVGSARYRLLPSALRGSTKLHLAARFRRVRDLSGWDAALAEASMLEHYFNALLRSGLAVPGGQEECRTALGSVLRHALPGPRTPLAPASGEESSHESFRWPEPRLLPLLALAQHHGLPTRLIDFTSDSRVAAYFAARSALRNQGKALSIWAVNAARLHLDVELRAKITEEGASTTAPGARLVFVDSTFNPRLRAQRGLFLLADAYAGTVAPGADVCRRPIEELPIPAFVDEPVRRYVLPARHTHELLELLAKSGVDAGTVFPDHAGAWDSVQERLAMGVRRHQAHRSLERRLLRGWLSEAPEKAADAEVAEPPPEIPPGPE